ncbi:unnamed protein product [Caenorhabditis angaria]|uniref:Uncharacterized protein n=1 Tax=Caenorhabditis angaria TaxID=860376 RepID=A0A9P1NAZ5_9PELO|nr:unnamed protein product [Caenorhabditis angaria]
MIKPDSPCNRIIIKMETTTEFVDTTDHSIYGLVVFLVILIFFASLTTGLILCLLKIWCSFHQQRRNSVASQRIRRSIVRGSPNFDSDSDEESDVQNTLSKRRFSQRLMSYVTKTLDKRDSVKSSKKSNVDQPQIHGRTGSSSSSRRVPEINIDPTSDAMESMLKGLQGVPPPVRRPILDENDPTNVIDV